MERSRQPLLPPRASLVAGARPDEPRANALLKSLERAFLFVERRSEALPSDLNPFAQLGALSNAALLTAVASGVLLLVFYKTSVTGAWQSVHDMDLAPFSSGLVRSLHRYSSDAAMLLALVHGGRIFSARRFTGARTWAYLTGISSVAVLWLVGWLGYWLVWDERAEAIAKLSARMMDPLPIFAEPLSRAFLVDAQVSSLLFFVIFFVHMLIPLLAGILLWLHVTRLSRPRFLPNRKMLALFGGFLVVASLLVPAKAAAPAKLLVDAPPGSLDGFFLLPLYLAHHLGGGTLWALCGLAVVTTAAVPYAFGKARAKVAQVHAAACNGCTLCSKDCPYDGIEMQPRGDGLRFELVAKVSSDKCVGCGICVGACDPGGIALPQFPTLPSRRQVDAFAAEGEFLLFACGSSAGEALRVLPDGSCTELVGYRVFAVPCAGWVQPHLVERALKGGAKGVLIVGCGKVEPTYREGMKWLAARLRAERRPMLRVEKTPKDRVAFVELGRGGLQELRRVATQFQQGVQTGSARKSRARTLGVAAASLTGLFGAVVGPSMLPFHPPGGATELLVSFRHPGQLAEGCRPATEADNAGLPVHMRRQQICERRRASVRLRVAIDGAVAFEQAYAPLGLRGDGTSVAIERVAMKPGAHYVKVELGDSPNADEWALHSERELTVEGGKSWAVLFDRTSGFRWHAPE